MIQSLYSQELTNKYKNPGFVKTKPIKPNLRKSKTNAFARERNLGMIYCILLAKLITLKGANLLTRNNLEIENYKI